AVNGEVGWQDEVVDEKRRVVAQEEADLAAARQDFESSVATQRLLDDTPGLALSLAKLGEVIAAEGDLAAAQRVLSESVVLQRDLGDLAGLAFVLERLAMVAATHEAPERALRLAGASSALLELLGMPLT